ncbi:AbrB/MazE/SpoVT family DNA-binding domain-containing protein [Hyalangium versicolor]|uniref:AbrB/MazE/SpoVT family DNA-binding domain-containing protein n=1 Tax=Hyalangium versicolor TaxID=2861190 RepID=UPI001CCD6C46|nr:AbrB/MazE/SpoVT family DNA-binding domain-containing protein [Hyalangium versicolor]
MIKKLTPMGEQQGLVLEPALLELLGVDQDTPLEVRTDGKVILVRPARESRLERLRGATERLMTWHAETLRKLAL